MSIEVFRPDTDPADPSVGLVLLNHTGSSVAEDTGRDAAYLAQALDAVVIAADRPGSTGPLPDPGLREAMATPAGYLFEMNRLGRDIGRAADNADLERLVITSHSAGALGALALARSGVLEGAGHVVVSEPVGSQATSLPDGRDHFERYRAAQALVQAGAGPERPVLPEPHGLTGWPAARRLAAIGVNGLNDRYHHAAIWASDAAAQYIDHIAERQTDTDLTVVYAEYSLAASPSTVAGMTRRTAGLRAAGGVPADVLTDPRTTHASFDNRDHKAGLIRPVIERARVNG